MTNLHYLCDGSPADEQARRLGATVGAAMAKDFRERTTTDPVALLRRIVETDEPGRGRSTAHREAMDAARAWLNKEPSP